MSSYHLLAILAIGLASNLDNAGVGIAYGVRKIRIPWYSNLAVAFISFLGTLLSGAFGSLLALWIHPWIGHAVGSVVIIAVGIWVLLQSSKEAQIQEIPPPSAGHFSRLLRNPEEADKDSSKSISLSEAMILGTALAMNALAGGFNAGVTELNIWLTSLSVGIFSYLLFALSAWFGEKYAAEKLGSRATIISGVLLIVIGLGQMW
ncbi:sporulation membrane protein YtaF [Paenibacillus physcomitrellae]|uniref:Sporulation membrane protein YtaF n=1 Tax=Paenibacillus physcomitrellae TaxID=1619311 RepID=A0ABQ1FR20_9BACL|nr:sporulation membrane protein YtaF [Paenibacillus physcomitrellae]GGA27411.1 sporulation membrane protein YtaF [Paenibacillus physcomitrellae]